LALEQRFRGELHCAFTVFYDFGVHATQSKGLEMTEVNIGGRTVLYNGTFLVRGGETVALTVPLDLHAPLEKENLKIEFTFGDPHEQDMKVTWVTATDGVVKFTLTGWKYGAGAALDLPLKFGSVYVSGQEHFLWFDMAHFLIGRSENLTHIILSRGQPNAR
jgi:hypothetical protein